MKLTHLSLFSGIGGFPCQPFSVAGKRSGKDDDRYLWPEMLRVIRELKPTWVIGENVPGIVNLALDTVLSDLEAEGFETQCFLVPACGVDAPHKRERACIVAHSLNRSGTLRRNREPEDTEGDGAGRDHHEGRTEEPVPGQRWQNESSTSGMADGLRAKVHRTDSYAKGKRLQGPSTEQVLGTQFTDCSCREREREKRVSRPTDGTGGADTVGEDWPPEPRMDRVVDGIPNRVDRIKCLGNAVVPQQFFPFFKWIAEEIQKES